ncbi:MAG: hypothetical protein U9P80_00100 [Thermodesulfobacteriota bacterium]|nr:hypothetical protein [Thermodesulfobacteriota bacterium]
MKNFSLGFSMVLVFFLAGCNPYTNTAVVATADLAGGSQQVALIDTDDPAVETDLGCVGAPARVLIAPDSKFAYIASNNADMVTVVDIASRELKASISPGSFIWDMDISEDGSRLAVGYYNWIPGEHRISVYNTSDFSEFQTFSIKDGLFDLKPGQSLAFDSANDAIYVIKGFFAPVVEAYTFDGTIWSETGSEFEIAAPSIADYFTVFDPVNPLLSDIYNLEISPDSKLLLAVSSRVYAFGINPDKTMENLYPAGLEVKYEDDIGNIFTLAGKTRVHFTDQDIVYINSAGMHADLGLTQVNLGGGSVCLSMKRLLAIDVDPFAFNIPEFIERIIPWIAEQLGYDTIADIIGATGLYGVSASDIDAGTCYMTISPIAAIDSDIVDIKNTLAVFQTIFGSGQIWAGGKVLDSYVNDLAINPARDTILFSHFWNKEISVLHKNPLLGWLFTDDLEYTGLSNYPKAIGMASIKN